MDLNQLLQQWLEEHDAALLITALNAYGKRVVVDNLLPDNAQPQIVVVKRDEGKK